MHSIAVVGYVTSVTLWVGLTITIQVTACVNVLLDSYHAKVDHQNEYVSPTTLI